MAESKAHRDWTKANTTFIRLKLNNNTDADILTEIKRLIRLGLKIENEH